MAIIKRKKKPAASPEAESAVTPEPEVIEDEEVLEDGTATGGTTALVTEKATQKTFEATRQMVREPEVVDGEATGETLKSLTFKVNNETLTESEFRRRYTPVNHVAAKQLREEPTEIAEEE